MSQEHKPLATDRQLPSGWTVTDHDRRKTRISGPLNRYASVKRMGKGPQYVAHYKLLVGNDRVGKNHYTASFETADEAVQWISEKARNDVVR